MPDFQIQGLISGPTVIFISALSVLCSSIWTSTNPKIQFLNRLIVILFLFFLPPVIRSFSFGEFLFFQQFADSCCLLHNGTLCYSEQQPFLALWGVTHRAALSAVQSIQKWALIQLYTILTPLSKTRLKLRVVTAVESTIITLSELSTVSLKSSALRWTLQEVTQGKTLLENRFASLFQHFGKDSILSSMSTESISEDSTKPAWPFFSHYFHNSMLGN